MKQSLLMTWLLISVFYLTACETLWVVKKNPGPPAHAKAHGFYKNNPPVAASQFYYYPSLEVYYNYSSREYTVYRNGNWVMINDYTVPVLYTQQYVIIADDRGKPWKYHAKHKLKYHSGYFKKSGPVKHKAKNTGMRKGPTKGKGKGR